MTRRARDVGSCTWCQLSFLQRMEVGTLRTSPQNLGQHNMVVRVRSELSDQSKRNGVEEEDSKVTLTGTAGSNKWKWATKDVKQDLNRRNEALVVSGGALDTEGLEEDVETLFRYKKDETVEVHKCRLRKFRTMLFYTWRKCARDTAWKREISRNG